MSERIYTYQSDKDQFVLTSDAEEYIRHREIPVCLICEKLVPNIQTSIGSQKEVIWSDNVFYPLINYYFECHGESLRFRTFGGEVARVEEGV